jgi:small nuclear ribonucleoprotein (snRNP)-like protein
VRAPLPSAPPLDNLSQCRSLLDPSDPEYAPPRREVREAATSSVPTRKVEEEEAEAAALAALRRGGPPLAERLTTRGYVDPAIEPAGAVVVARDAQDAELVEDEDGAHLLLPAAPPLRTRVRAATHAEGPMSVLRRLLSERRRARVVIRRSHSVRGHCDGFIRAFDKHMNMVLLDVSERFSRLEWRGRERVEVWRTRHARQLLLRGDNVVSVYAAPLSASAAAAPAPA